jgi:hypothetical protein
MQNSGLFGHWFRSLLWVPLLGWCWAVSCFKNIGQSSQYMVRFFWHKLEGSSSDCDHTFAFLRLDVEFGWHLKNAGRAVEGAIGIGTYLKLQAGWGIFQSSLRFLREGLRLFYCTLKFQLGGIAPAISCNFGHCQLRRSICLILRRAQFEYS